MKNYKYHINNSNSRLFFPEFRIKTKKQILKILLETVRIIIVSSPDESIANNTLHFKIVVDKMSRLFFFGEKKYYSIFFPFALLYENGTVSISYKNLVDINSQIISKLIEVINDERFESELSLDFIEPINEIESNCNSNIWFLLKELLLFEDGYLRYDNDPESHENAKKKGKEHTHPENHIDVFYSNGNTFKLGLEKCVDSNDFEDYLNTKTDCMYLKNYR